MHSFVNCVNGYSVLYGDPQMFNTWEVGMALCVADLTEVICGLLCISAIPFFFTRFVSKPTVLLWKRGKDILWESLLVILLSLAVLDASAVFRQCGCEMTSESAQVEG